MPRQRAPRAKRPRPSSRAPAPQMGRCNNFREAAEVVGRQAFPMFLNVTANVTNWNADGTECSLVGAARKFEHEQAWLLCASRPAG